MPIISAGLLMYRYKNGELQFFLIHPGGPIFAKKDLGVWSLPKGTNEEGEDYFTTAKREFIEETGVIPEEPFIELGQVRQRSTKIVYAWGFETSIQDDIVIVCNTFSMEWPPRSKKFKKFPEADKGEFFNYETAMQKMLPAQTPFIERLKIYLENK